MFYIFAGFYCNPAQQQENDAFNHKLALFAGFIGALYIFGWLYLYKAWAAGHTKRTLMLTISMILVGLFILATLLLIALRFSPHWC